MKPMATSAALATYGNVIEETAEEPNYEADGWDYEFQEEFEEDEEEDLEPPREGLLYFEADREYDEDEAMYVWAYNDAYAQFYQDMHENASANFPAYQDVRKEMQAVRKGRQFFRPEKGRGRGKSKGAGKGGKRSKGKKGPRSSSRGKGGHRGTPEELLAKTRCFNCGELGHFSRDCPNGQSNPTGRNNFVVSQGPFPGAINRTFMVGQSVTAIYAGVRTAAGQGLVDTAAEDAVIGSSAFSRLKQLLEHQGLRPVAVKGPVGACAGIGGSAQVTNVWDLPIGIAGTNGLLRVTEVADSDGFETPFLIPISFQELVGLVIDLDRGEVRTRSGNVTTMQRLPTGHRAVSVVEFSGKWALPKELMRGGRDPFQLPKHAQLQPKPGPVDKHRGVAVWLRFSDGSLQQQFTMQGCRKALVLPQECFAEHVVSTLEPTRVTYLDPSHGGNPYVINDKWNNSLGNRQLEEPWSGTVIFQQLTTAAPTSSSSTARTTSATTTPVSQAAGSAHRGAACQATQHFDMSDGSSSSGAGAIRDFEEVFSSVSGGSVVVNAPRNCAHAPHVSDAWAAFRCKSRRIFDSLQQNMRKRSAFFLNMAQRVSRSSSSPMLGALLRRYLSRVGHATPDPGSCGAGARRGDYHGMSSQGFRVELPCMGKVGEPPGANDPDHSPAVRDRRGDPHAAPSKHGLVFVGTATVEKDSAQSTASSPRPGSSHVQKSGQAHLDSRAGSVFPCGTGPTDARKSGTVLVDMPEVRFKVAENNGGDHRGHECQSSACEKGVPQHCATKAAAASEIQAGPGNTYLGAGQDTNEASDGSGTLDHFGNFRCETYGTGDRSVFGESSRERGPVEAVLSPERQTRVPKGPLRAGEPRAGVRVPRGGGGQPRDGGEQLRSSPAGRVGSDAVSHGVSGEGCGPRGCTAFEEESATANRMGGLRSEDSGSHGRGGVRQVRFIEEVPQLAVGGQSNSRTISAKASSHGIKCGGDLCDPRREQRGPLQGEDAELVLTGGLPGPRGTEGRTMKDSAGLAAHTTLTTSTPTFSMLGYFPENVRAFFAKRGYTSTCGLALLLSVVGSTFPIAASETSMLPFYRLEAGIMDGIGVQQSHNFVLFEVPDTFDFSGSTCDDHVCILPRPTKGFVIEQLENFVKNTGPPTEQPPELHEPQLLSQGETTLWVCQTADYQTKSASTTTSGVQSTTEHQQQRLDQAATTFATSTARTFRDASQRQRLRVHEQSKTTDYQTKSASTTTGSMAFLETADYQTISASTTTGVPPCSQQKTGVHQVRSYVMPQSTQRSSASSLVDGEFSYTGPVGIRSLSFLYAWVLENPHDRRRILAAAKETTPAIVACPITGACFSTMLEVARLQDQAGRLFCLVSPSKFKRSLLHQLPSATAVPLRFTTPGPICWLIVNDKTLVRMFSTLGWSDVSWHETDQEDLNRTVMEFVDGLCNPGELKRDTPFPNAPGLRRLAEKCLPTFNNLLTAVRTHSAFCAGGFTAASSFGGEIERFQPAQPYLPPTASSATATILAIGQDGETLPALPETLEDEEMRFGPREGDEDGDEAVQEVRRGLRPITASEQVIRAMKEVDDFRKHEESGKYSLHPHLRRELFKVHRNLGHPAKDVFLRALKHSGAREDVLQWTKEHFRCPLCEASRRPSSARPAHLAKTLQFNAIIAIDLFYLNLFGAERVFLVCVDHGTGLVQAALCADARSATVKDVFATTWIKPFGHPELVISDLGPEFFGEPFQEYLASAGTALHFTDAMSPWQNGRAERAVQSMKSKLKTVIADTTATLDELEICLTQVVAAHNQMYDRFGFSPNQRVFGRSIRLPGSLLADDSVDSQLVQEAAGDEMKRTWEIREAAQLAWLKKSDQAAVQKARRVLTRKADEKSAALHPGQWVYVWRRTESKYGWTGPGSLVAPCPGGNSWWLNMKGRLWKVNVEQLRPATNEENLGAAMAQELHRDLLRQLREGVHNGYQDVTQDGSPEDFADIEPSEAEEDTFPLQTSEEQPPHEPMATEPDVAESAGDTTTLGDELSDLVVPSEVQGSRRHSVQSTTTEVGPSPPERRTIRVDEGSSGTMSFGPVRPTSSTSTSAPYATTSENVEVASSEYLEVMDPDFDADATSSNYVSVRGPRWIKQTSSGRTWLEPLKPMVSFAAHEGELNYCRRDRCMYATKAKTSFGQVEFGKLPEAEKKVFRASRAKEFKSLLDNKAIRVLTLEESREFRKRHPESILESRFVDRFKPLDVKQEDLDKVKKAAIETGQLAPLELATDFSSPKSRWCVVGWRDPLIHQIERSAPTPAGNAVNTVLQLAASRRWTTFVRDVKTAFLQSRPTDRATPLACTQPKDEPLPELHPEQLILLLTEVYGLVSGPAWWRSTFLQRTGKHGYRTCPYEPCILLLPGSTPGSNTVGAIVIEVDDLIECGEPQHRACMKKLEGEITFGKVENLQESETSYAGKMIKQNDDFSFTIHMEPYIYTRMAPVVLARKVLKRDASRVALTDFEQTQLRGAIASIAWASRECRPDVAAAASILAGAFPEPTADTVFQVNDVIKHLKQHPLKLKIHAIPEANVRNLLVADAAFDTSGQEKSQHGYLLGFTDHTMNNGHSAPVSLIMWRSKRLRRRASSSMLCEALSLSAASASLEKQDALWSALRVSNYDPRARQRTEEEVLELQGRSTVVATDSAAYRDPRSVIVIDAKSLYDHLLGDQPGECGRCNLEVAVIKESIQICAGRVRWVPHNCNPSDALTKFPGAHVEPMIRLLKTHRYQVCDEGQTLAQGKQGERRLKQGINTSHSGNNYLLGAVSTRSQSRNFPDVLWGMPLHLRP